MKLNPWLAGLVSVVGTALVPTAYCIWVASTDNSRAAVSETIAYFIVFSALALPGLVLAIFVADLIVRQLAESGKGASIVVAIVAAVGTSSATYMAVYFIAVSKLADAEIMVIPALLGLIGAILFLSIRRQVERASLEVIDE